MRFIIFCSVTALAGYVFGYSVGKWTAEAEVEEKRTELGLNDNTEDEYELFK
jgi:hypothetical protein